MTHTAETAGEATGTDAVEMLFEWNRLMRGEDPVSFDENAGVWHVFRYSDVKAALGRPGEFSSEFPAQFTPSWEGGEILGVGNFALKDPPRHTALRNLVAKAFTPASVAAMEPTVLSVATAVLDAADRAGGVVDFVRDVAFTIPLTVIAEMIGFGTGDRDLFARWMETNLAHEVRDAGNAGLDSETYQAMVCEIGDFLLDRIRERREKPRQDLLSRLLIAEVDGERLTDHEIASTALLLSGGGYVTTMSMLSSLVLIGARHPESWARLRADRSLIPSALDEVVRVRPPFSRVVRWVPADADIGGRRIPAGSVVVLWITSANRDEEQFVDPDTVDFGRRPNPHLGFGRGIHFCLGAPLARLEGRVVAELMLDRYESVELAGPEPPPTFDPAGGILALSALPVRLNRAT